MMKKLKVLLSSRPKLLSEVIRYMIEHQSDMEVVGEVLDPLQLLHASRKTVVDVVIITPLKANGEPKICHVLLAEHPLLIIVTQSAKGEAAYLYQSGVDKQRIDEPSGQSILGAIRMALPSVVS
jgi:DNA-binding NarL/FixJ family response regulator